MVGPHEADVEVGGVDRPAGIGPGAVLDALAAQAKAGSFLESPAPDLAAAVDESIGERPGTAIGTYKLLEQIGEGDLVVIQTEDEDVGPALELMRNLTNERVSTERDSSLPGTHLKPRERGSVAPSQHR